VHCERVVAGELGFSSKPMETLRTGREEGDLSDRATGHYSRLEGWRIKPPEAFCKANRSVSRWSMYTNVGLSRF